MFRTKFIWWSLLSLVLIVVLAVGGFALYRLSWSQGYMAGQQAPALGAVPSPAPGLPYGFFPGGWLLSFLVFLFVAFIISKIVRMMFWLSAGPSMMGSWKRDWRHSPHHRPYHRGPWCYGWDDDEEAQKESEAPEQNTSKA